MSSSRQGIDCGIAYDFAKPRAKASSLWIALPLRNTPRNRHQNLLRQIFGVGRLQTLINGSSHDHRPIDSYKFLPRCFVIVALQSDDQGASCRWIGMIQFVHLKSLHTPTNPTLHQFPRIFSERHLIQRIPHQCRNFRWHWLESTENKPIGTL